VFSLVRAFQKMDPAAKNSWEVFFLYPGFKAIIFHRLAHVCYKFKIPFIHRLVSEISRFKTGIDIHPGAVLGIDVVIDHGMGTVIGETAVIGNQVLIHQGVTLGGTEIMQWKQHPNIADDVVLRAGCKILGNICIDEGTRVGANAVVLKDVPPHSIAVGIPAEIYEKDSATSKGWNLEY